ncbi:MAG: histidine phosphatase family protein [Verrucomicrobia bacterium]|nr:histidine phosphatase family protein [Verrucomicrobiota bacterium]
MYFLSVILCFFSSLCSLPSPVAAEENEAMTRFLYIRHGEVPGNDPNPATYIYTGSGTNGSLTEKGKIQALECAKRVSQLQKSARLGKITAIYASDLIRAQETAAPIGNELGLNVELRTGLREINWGAADGQLVKEMADQYGAMEDQVKDHYPDRKVRWDYLPVFEGAESYNALLKRSLSELTQIAEEHPGETVIIVGHGRVLKTLIADCRGSEEKMPYPANCGIAEFTYSSDKGLQFVNVVEENL